MSSIIALGAHHKRPIPKTICLCRNIVGGGVTSILLDPSQNPSAYCLGAADKYSHDVLRRFRGQTWINLSVREVVISMKSECHTCTCNYKTPRLNSRESFEP
jgi:hypothetical protein